MSMCWLYMGSSPVSSKDTVISRLYLWRRTAESATDTTEPSEYTLFPSIQQELPGSDVMGRRTWSRSILTGSSTISVPPSA